MSSIFDIVLIFFVFFTCFHAITATDIIKDDESDKRAHSDRGTLWFGPRLGKRSLELVDEDNSQAILRLLEAADAVKYYYNQLPYEMQSDAPETKVTKKVIYAPKYGRTKDLQQRRYNHIEFTPRLGRKLTEKMPVTPAEEESYGLDPMKTNLVPKENIIFRPRLGRELLYDFYSKPQIRVTRSVNKTIPA